MRIANAKRHGQKQIEPGQTSGGTGRSQVRFRCRKVVVVCDEIVDQGVEYVIIKSHPILLDRVILDEAWLLRAYKMCVNHGLGLMIISPDLAAGKDGHHADGRRESTHRLVPR